MPFLRANSSANLHASGRKMRWDEMPRFSQMRSSSSSQCCRKRDLPRSRYCRKKHYIHFLKLIAGFPVRTTIWQLRTARRSLVRVLRVSLSSSCLRTTSRSASASLARAMSPSSIIWKGQRSQDEEDILRFRLFIGHWDHESVSDKVNGFRGFSRISPTDLRDLPVQGA